MAASKLQKLFGKTVRKLRTDRGMSQEELAFESGLTRNYISILELGQQSPSLDTLYALAKALDMSVTSLIEQAEKEL